VNTEEAAMSGKASTGLLRIRHDQHDLECLTGRILSDTGGAWFLRIQASEEAGEYREHLVRGAPMDLTLVANTGDRYAGEACVASVSMAHDGAALVVLTGIGPLLPQ
jgi:hypothetical protein